jgi:hypothetical protein
VFFLNDVDGVYFYLTATHNIIMGVQKIQSIGTEDDLSRNVSEVGIPLLPCLMLPCVTISAFMGWCAL